MQYVTGFLVLLLLSLTGCGGTISGYISSESLTPEVVLSTDKMIYEVTEGEDVDLQVILDQAVTSEVAVYWTLEDPNASGPFGLFGTSLSSADFSALSGRLTVPAGIRQVSLKLPSLADLTYENNEEFDLVLTTGDEKEHRVEVRVTDSDSKPTVSLSAAMMTEGQSGQIQVNFSKRSAYKTTLNYEIVPGTAALGSEFSSLTGTFEVDPNTLVTNLSMSILDDGDTEGNEYFQIRLTTADHALVDTTLVSVTVLDDEDGPKLKMDSQTITESGGTLRVKVTYADISQVRTLPVYFDWNIIDGDANEADDFVAAGGTGVVIYPGENEVYLDIPIIDDLKYELDEAFDVVLSNVVNAGLAVDQATVTITDNDPMPELEWQIAQTSALEGAFGSFSVTAKLNQASGLDVTASVNTSGSATAQDYNLPTNEITIPAGATEAQFTVEVVDDSAVANDKELILTLGGLTNAQAGTQLNHTIEIIDDDGTPLMFVSNTSISESAGTGSVVISLSKPLEISESVDFSYSAADGSAGALDYTLSAGSATINGGESSYSIPITINDDNIYEGNEQLTVSVSSSDPDVSIQPGSETGYVTIVDNDSAPVIEFAQASSTAAENIGSAVTITVNQTGQTSLTSTVSYIIGGTATYASDGSKDHRLSSGTLTFLSGETSKTISVMIDDDSLQEGDETIVVTLVNPTSATLGATQIHTLTITDDESLPHLSVAGASTTEGVDAEFTVTLTVAVSYPVSVDYVISDGTAISPDDHAGGTGQLTIYPGDGLSKKIYVSTVDDALYEGDETLDVTISNPDPTSVIIDTATDTSTIVDNEGTPTLTISDATITEGSPGTATVTVDPVSTQAITVNYASSDISATAGSDYTAVSGTLTIPAGNSTANINLTSSDDSTYEGDETFSVALSLPSAGSQLGTPATGTVTITDNETMPPTVQFNVASNSVTESVGSVNIQVDLSSAATTNVTIPYTISGTSSAPSDHDLVDGSLVISPSDGTSKNIVVNIVDDGNFEPTEDLIVTLGTPTGATVSGNNPHTLTITDDDSKPTIDWASSTISVNEGDGTITASLTLSSPLQTAETIAYTVQGASTATGGGTDYTMTTSSPVAITAGATTISVQIALNDDSLSEGQETIVIQVHTPSTNVVVGSTDTITISIVDNEGPQVTQVTTSQANGIYTIGETIPIAVDFNRAVTLSGGTLQLTLETGTTDRVVTLDQGSGTTTISGTYTVQAGDVNSDLDFVSTASLALNAGTLRDTSNVDADLTLPSPGAVGSLANAHDVEIDTIAPIAPSTIDDLTWSTSATQSTVITYSGQSDANSGIAQIRGRVVTLPSTPVTSYAVFASGNQIAGSFSHNTTYAVQIEVTDNAGNISTATSDGWTVDMVAPTTPGTLSQSADPSNTLRDTPTFTFTDSTDALSGMSGYQIAIYDSGDTEIQAYTTASGDGTGLSYSHGSDLLNPGSTYYVKVRAVDVAGNISAEVQGSNWAVPTVCPTGFVEVPGNASLGTANFCVAQFEMKGSTGNISSQGSGTTYTSITALDAFTECSNMTEAGFTDGEFALISNPEWMTIARDAEATASNWSGGVMSGGWGAHTSYGDAWSNSIPAPVSDATCVYNTAANTCGSTGNHKYKRTVALSNSQEIWDLAGNIWEWVDWDSSDGIFTTGPTTCGSSWNEFSSSCSDLVDDDYKPTGPYTSVENVGRWIGGPGGAVLRGGHFADGSYTGIFTLNLYHPTSYTLAAIGFRCVYRPFQILEQFFDERQVYESPGVVYTSTTATNTSSLSVSVSVSGGGSPELLVNGTPSGTSVTVDPGDTLAFRLTASAVAGDTETITLTSSGYSLDITLTTTFVSLVDDAYYSYAVLLLPLVDDGSGGLDLTDYSYNGKMITNASDIVAWQTAQQNFYGGAAYFSGSSGQQLLTDLSDDFNLDSHDFTIEYWFKRAGNITSSSILQMSSGVDLYSMLVGYDLGTPDQPVVYISNNGSSWAVSGQSMGANFDTSWHHYAISRNGATIKTFQDGVEVSSGSLSGDIFQATHQISFGKNQNVHEFQGYLQDVRVYKGLSKYNSNFTPPGKLLLD